MYEGAQGRTIFDYISDKKLAWTQIEDPFERFIYPDFTFEVHADALRYRRDLVALFPEEKTAIARYFRDVERVSRWGMRRFIASELPAPLRRPARWLASRRSELPLSLTRDYLDRSFRDPRLKALLVSQWRDYGLPPDQSAFMVHAVIAEHYFRGAYFPVGGASSIARTIIPVVESAGGRFFPRHEVQKILVERGRAVGVEAVHRKGGRDRKVQLRAPVVISDAGAYNTYARLLTRNLVGDYVERMETLGQKPTSASVYLGFRESPACLGFRGENHWISEDYQHDQQRETEDVLRGRPSGCYLSFPSLKNPEAQTHTAEILVMPGYDAFKRWADLPWQKRGTEYEALKQRMADGMIDMVERRFPGFRDLIEHCEVSTPLSVEHFAGSPKGAIYGLPATPARFRQAWLGTRTPVANLYLAGADVYMHGVLGAAIGGVAAAGACLGPFGFLRAMRAISAEAAR